MNIFGKRNAAPSTVNPIDMTSANQELVVERGGVPKHRGDSDRGAEDEDGLELAAVTVANSTAERHLHQQQQQPREQTIDNNGEAISSENRKNSLNAEPLLRIACTVLPKVEPLPWTTFFCLSMWCTVPAAVYILLFTVSTCLSLVFLKLCQLQSPNSLSLIIVALVTRKWDLGSRSTTLSQTNSEDLHPYSEHLSSFLVSSSTFLTLGNGIHLSVKLFEAHG